LGTSINYVFLYNHQTKNTLILPLDSIDSIVPKKSLKLKVVAKAVSTESE
jgi:hypothetical protein